MLSRRFWARTGTNREGDFGHFLWDRPIGLPRQAEACPTKPAAAPLAQRRIGWHPATSIARRPLTHLRVIAAPIQAQQLQEALQMARSAKSTDLDT